MTITKRDFFVALLVGGILSSLSSIFLIVFDFPYPAAAGVLASAYLAFLVTGNRHEGFRTALADGLSIFICNYIFCFLAVLLILILRRS